MTSRARVSRRSLFALAGSGAALLSLFAFWRPRESGVEAARAEPAAPPLVDHDGWILTPEDKQALTPARQTR
jgi:hypothetical protein